MSVGHNDANLQKAISYQITFYELRSSGGLRQRRRLSRDAALAPVIGYDKASKIAHFAIDHDPTLKGRRAEARLRHRGRFDRVVDPAQMVKPYVAGSGTPGDRARQAKP
jgi:aspartate ammonia-lyase